MIRRKSLLLLYCPLLLLAGCARPNPDLATELSPDAYSVSVKILEYSDRVGAKFKDGREKSIAKVMADKDTMVTSLPTVHLQPGQSREMDRRKEYPFPVAMATDTTPIRYESVTTGEYLRVTLSLMPSGAPALGIQLDAPKVVAWEDLLGPGGITYKHPRTKTILVHSTLSPPWSTWQVVDRNASAAVIVRVDQPTLGPRLTGSDR